MNKFSVDYSDLQSKLNRKKAFRLADVKDRIRKVAFDVVRFMDSNKIDELWQIHRDGDDEYIVAMYEDEETKTAEASIQNQWSVELDKSSQYAHVFFKSTPVTKLALSQLGIPSSESYLVKQFLPNKLASDKGFRQSFIGSLNPVEREALEQEDPSLLADK